MLAQARGRRLAQRAAVLRFLLRWCVRTARRVRAFVTRKEIHKMSGFLMAAGRLGSIAALIALLIILVKKLITLVSFLMIVLKGGNLIPLFPLQAFPVYSHP